MNILKNYPYLAGIFFLNILFISCVGEKKTTLSEEEKEEIREDSTNTVVETAVGDMKHFSRKLGDIFSNTRRPGEMFRLQK